MLIYKKRIQDLNFDMIVFNRPKLYKNTLQYCFSTSELRVTIRQNTKSWTKIKMKMLHIAMKFALISLKCTITHSKIIDIVSSLSFIFYSRSRIEMIQTNSGAMKALQVIHETYVMQSYLSILRLSIKKCYTFCLTCLSINEILRDKICHENFDA